MAPAHYGEVAVSFYEDEGLDYVPRKKNAPNVPQARPIERFWALCKAAYRRRKKAPKTLQYFRTVWKNLAKKVAQSSGRALMKRLRGKLRAIAYGGVYAILR
jgi:transcription initiation factor TFIIIB Brf1 subunit/transcription initiation factor TFIIB